MRNSFCCQGAVTGPSMGMVLGVSFHICLLLAHQTHVRIRTIVDEYMVEVVFVCANQLLLLFLSV